MTYPVLGVVEARNVADELRSSSLGVSKLPPGIMDRSFKELEKLVVYADGADVDVAMIYAESERFRDQLFAQGELAVYRDKAVERPSADSEYLEELMAERLHSLLDGLPAVVLHDARFWRFLGLFPFRWFLLLREPELQPQDFGGTDSGRHYWLLIRTYQWGRKCHTIGSVSPYEHVYKARETRRSVGASEGFVIDYYHSHIVRPRWADAASVATGFISATAAPPPIVDTSPLPTEPVRTFARRVSRLSGNVCLPYLDSATLDDILARERR
jgi:hypothetical protein